MRDTLSLRALIERARRAQEANDKRIPVQQRIPSTYPVTCPACGGTGGGVYNDCAVCDGNGVV